MNWFTRLLCSMWLHYYDIQHNGERYVSQCNWCHSYERGYEP